MYQSADHCMHDLTPLKIKVGEAGLCMAGVLLENGGVVLSSIKNKCMSSIKVLKA